MKKLFLASILPYVRDKLIDFLGKISDSLVVAFIPTAADPYKDKWFVKADRDLLEKAGFKIKDLDIKNQTEQKLFKALKNIDIIFVAGGNTFYLLQEARRSGFDKIVKRFIQRGVIYVGASAGAVLAGPTIEPLKTLDDSKKAPALQSFKGLSLVDFVVLPHYGERKYKKRQEEILQKHNNRGYEIIPITNQQAVAVQGVNYHVV